MGICLKKMGFIIFLDLGLQVVVVCNSPAVTGKCTVMSLEHQTCQADEEKKDSAPDWLEQTPTHGILKVFRESSSMNSTASQFRDFFMF